MDGNLFWLQSRRWRRAAHSSQHNHITALLSSPFLVLFLVLISLFGTCASFALSMEIWGPILTIAWKCCKSTISFFICLYYCGGEIFYKQTKSHCSVSHPNATTLSMLFIGWQETWDIYFSKIPLRFEVIVFIYLLVALGLRPNLSNLSGEPRYLDYDCVKVVVGD